MDDNDRVGRRIANQRKSHGLTQQQLAQAAGVSKSTLEKVESGHQAASNAWIGMVAKALAVDITVLTGGPNAGGTADNAAVHRLVPDVRRALAAWDLAGAADDVPAPSLDQLVTDVGQLHEWRHAAKYEQIGTTVPGVLAGLVRFAGEHNGAERAHAFKLLTQAYRAANTFAHKLGYVDLSLTALDRMEWAARQSEDPLLAAVVDYVRSGALTRLGEHQAAIRLLNRAIASVEPLAGASIDAKAVLGSLHMKLIGVYGAMADGDMLATHLAEAERFAAMMGSFDRRVYETIFGPTNVQLHALSAHVDMAQSSRALQIAHDTALDPDMSKERRSYFYIDLARAWLLNGNVDLAVEALYEARVSAPLHFDNSKVVRGTLYTLAERKRRTSGDLRALARHAGIVD